MITPPTIHAKSPPSWAVPLAFGLVYLAWGTTYLAISVGVQELPPALFGGTRVGSAGLVLLAYLRCTGESLWMPRREVLWSVLIGCILFVGGNLLVTLGLRTVPSSAASVLVATTPLWIALIESLSPGGERMTVRGWFGITLGLGGVLLLLAPKLNGLSDLWADTGAVLVIASAFAWSVGSIVVRRVKRRSSHLVAAAYQMVFGGLAQAVVGLFLGEYRQLTPDRFTPGVVYSFFHLLVVGSLIGFVAYSWLLKHVSASQAGTYAYVNPLVAVLVGWLIGKEAIHISLIGGMAVILLGVALVRNQTIKPKKRVLEVTDGEDEHSQSWDELAKSACSGSSKC